MYNKTGRNLCWLYLKPKTKSKETKNINIHVVCSMLHTQRLRNQDPYALTCILPNKLSKDEL